MYTSLRALDCIKITFLIVMVMTIAGCGGVDWFPAYKRLPTTPDFFSFPSKTGVELATKVTSEAITVSGLTGDSSPIKISGGTNSKYSINDGAETDAEGTVKNGDKVTVSHTSAAAVGTLTTTTVDIGNLSGTFTSTTRLVTLVSFISRTQFGNLFQTFAVATSIDTAGHLVSITDSNNSALFSVANTAGDPTTWYTTSSGKVTISFLNGLRIFVRKEDGSTTKLIIDDVEFPVTLPAQ